MRVGSRGERPLGFWQTAEDLGSKSPLSVERFGKASALESKRQRGSATRFGSFSARSLLRQGGEKLRQLGWSAFVLRQRRWNLQSRQCWSGFGDYEYWLGTAVGFHSNKRWYVQVKMRNYENF